MKTRVLWLCNIVFPWVAEKIGLRNEIGGGWMLGLLKMMQCANDIELSVLAPSEDIKEYVKTTEGGVHYHIVPSSDQIPKLVEDYKLVLEDNHYDIIHIFGSEYISSLAMAKAAYILHMEDRILLHIQGLVSIYSQHFAEGMPKPWIYLKTPRDFYKDTSVIHQMKDFVCRGKYEKSTVKLVKNIGFRTQWDKACAYQINPEADFYYNGEILRESFYDADWSIDFCERHSVFVSQGNYPLKGLHQMLLALPYIRPHFPDIKLYVAGFSPLSINNSILSFLKRSDYGHYLAYIIKKYNLSKSIVFTGPLNETQMCDRYLKSHVFVCPSSIENSPNSLGEAMLLGMPCIASFVGGVPDMLEHGKDGYLYPFNAPYMLAHYIMCLFKDDQLCVSFGASAKQHAIHTHNKKEVLNNILTTYKTIKDMNQ